MSCPTCDGTMECVFSDITLYGTGRKMFACPRCGTMRTINLINGVPGHAEDCVPKLVQRCREFEQQEFMAYSPEKGHGVVDPPDRWRTLGIAEAINPPGKRPA